MGKNTESRSLILKKWNMFVCAILAIALLFPRLTIHGRPQTTSQTFYAVTDLGNLGSASAQAYDINEAGHIVGYSVTADAKAHAFLWQNGVMKDLGTLGGNYASAQAINETDQIVGRSTMTPTSVGHAVLWEGGAKTDLTPGTTWSIAYGINDARQVVGTINDAIAFLWQNGVMTNLGNLGGGGASAMAINNAGQIVGTSYTTIVGSLGPTTHAFVWQNGVMKDLGVFTGHDDSGATGINTSGQIVGWSSLTDHDTYETDARSFLYEGGVMTALPVPSVESYAQDINDYGQIVGVMRAGGGLSNQHAYIYSDGVVADLNSRIAAGSGLHLSVATGINNAGQISAWGLDSSSHYHAFLLTPLGPDTPVVSVGDVSVNEGDAGTRSADFTVSLSPASNQPVSVAYSTANFGATAGSDYQSASGTLTFAPGQTTKTISVLVNGDRVGEPNETFFVNLGQVTGPAIIGDGQAVGTIVDDEPRASINNVTQPEGNSGTTPFVFTVTLSPAPTAVVTVNFATANGSARASEDYDSRSGSLTFNPGETSKTVPVTVKGDKKIEGDETFYVRLTGGTGAFLLQSGGAGMITNDDH